MESGIIKKALLCVAIVLVSMHVEAQKTTISDQDEIIKTAAGVFEQSMKDGSLYELGQEHQVTGAYIFDITIRNKGEVASVFVVENEGGTIPFQNMVKDHVKNMKMGFKMPKNKNYKFRYKFDFNK